MPARERKLLEELRRDGLVVEASRLGAVIRGPGDAAEPPALAEIPAADSDAVVFGSPTVAAHPGLLTALGVACRMLQGRPARYWIAIGGLGRWGASAGDALRGIAGRHGVEVLAPSAEIAVPVPGVLFAGDRGGCWYRFTPMDAERPAALRYPVPAWEPSLPRSAITVAGLCAEPVPAGLLVRPASSTSDGFGGDLPLACDAPKLMIGRGGEAAPAPKAVAAVLSGIAAGTRARLLVVPGNAEVSEDAWLSSLAEAFGHEVYAAAGMPFATPGGGESMRPRPGASWRSLATVLRHTADGPPSVVLAGAAPPGFRAACALHYVPDGPSGQRSVLRVIPAGAALLTADELDRCVGLDRIPTEADRMRVIVGLPGRPVPVHAPELLGDVLRALRDHCGRTRVSVLGGVRADQRSALERVAHGLADGIEFATAEPNAANADMTIVVSRSTIVDNQAVRPVLRLVGEPTGEQLADPMDRFRRRLPDEPGPSAHTPQDSRPTLVPAGAQPPLVAADHRSTQAERDGFVRAYAAEYDEAVATVNAALATSPGLRSADGEAGKIDFVAVRLYTTGGRAGGGALNERLRAADASSEDYLACLTSGLRRLPVHRGAAFGFTGLGEEPAAANPYRQGAVLVEPGLFSTTAAAEVRVPGADVDLVVWSRSGRRTGAFGGGDLPQEVVFAVGSRFKVLAVHPGAEDADAVLLRELRPGEAGAPGTLDDTDLAVLPKLERALERRRIAEPQMLADGEYLRRVRTPVGLVESVPQTLAAAG